MRVLVCGGRDYHNVDRLNEVLNYYHSKRPFSLLIHGAARGADRLAHEWAIFSGIEVRPFPADWDAYFKAAGSIRNTQMLRRGKPDIVIAFPGGRGTKDMIRQSERAFVPVLRIDQE